MKFTSLFFRDTLKVRADYGKVVNAFKAKLDETYFKGYIARDETQLFYFSGYFKRPLSANLPIIQLNFGNEGDDKGEIKIRFKIVNFALGLFGAANGIILFFSIADLPDQPRIPSIVPLITFAASYCFLLFMYLVELSAFKKEITGLELRK